MQQLRKQMGRILVLVIAGTLALACPSVTEKPAWASGGEKSGKHEGKEDRRGKHEKKEDHSGKGGRNGGDSRGHGDDDGKVRFRFDDRHRHVIRDYYKEQYHSGHCPPGLARKNYGCVPPGHAKRWVIGRPLPPDIVFYELPPVIITELGPPPPGYHYVRVDSDILLLAIGTGLVIDALQGLNDY